MAQAEDAKIVEDHLAAIEKHLEGLKNAAWGIVGALSGVATALILSGIARSHLKNE